MHRRAPRSCGAGFVEDDRLYFPVPVKLDVCGLLLALSLTLNFPVLVPVSVGVKVTPIVHFALATSRIFMMNSWRQNGSLGKTTSNSQRASGVLGESSANRKLSRNGFEEVGRIGE